MAGKNGVDLEVEVVDNTELQDSSSKDSGQQPRRIPKCSGCKLPHEGHTWADPGPYCTGPSDEHTDAVGKNTDAVGEPKDQRDEEQALVEQLHKLTMAEQAIEKANRIDQLKLAIAESHKRIMDLKQKRPLSSNQTKPSLDDSLPPTIPLSSSSQAAASGSGSGSSSTVPVYSSLSTGAIPSLAAGMAGFRPGTSGTSGTRGTSHVTPLDGLLADYLPGAAPQWHVNNPDGSLAPPHAAQESRMFLKPAQLAKDALDPTLAKQLEEEIFHFRSHTFSTNTKATYRTHRNSYLRFCQRMGYPPVPAQPEHICQYAAFLARSLKPASIPTYLNIISILHKEFNLPNPLANNWPLNSLLTGIKRVKGQPPSQKLPISPDLLLRIHSRLNLRSSFDASFWAICLVSFFGMLRKSHFLASSASSFDPSQQLILSDLEMFPWGVLITLRWSKTIQFRERVVKIPLPLIQNSPLCPVAAIQRALSFIAHPPQPSPVFMWVDLTSLSLRIFTYSQFLKRLRAILQALGLSARDYACHSFRRGGASFAFQAGLPIDLINILGDWHSDAVLLYLTVPLSVRLESINIIAKYLSTSTSSTVPHLGLE
ncbi:uncharacterized protein LOC144645323 [Oculina patagonica]